MGDEKKEIRGKKKSTSREMDIAMPTGEHRPGRAGEDGTPATGCSSAARADAVFDDDAMLMLACGTDKTALLVEGGSRNRGLRPRWARRGVQIPVLGQQGSVCVGREI